MLGLQPMEELHRVSLVYSEEKTHCEVCTHESKGEALHALYQWSQTCFRPVQYQTVSRTSL